MKVSDIKPVHNLNELNKLVVGDKVPVWSSILTVGENSNDKFIVLDHEGEFPNSFIINYIFNKKDVEYQNGKITSIFCDEKIDYAESVNYSNKINIIRGGQK